MSTLREKFIKLQFSSSFNRKIKLNPNNQQYMVRSWDLPPIKKKKKKGVGMCLLKLKKSGS